MARFKTELVQSVIERATVFVQADTADEAEKVALKESVIGFAEFRFRESGGDIEVIHITELKP
jgi:hypothetical protein